MAEEPPRRITRSLPRVVREENVAPPRKEELLVAQPLPRIQTPVGMPAPPHDADEGDRQSHDDLEHIAQIDQLERERAQLLVKLQDKDSELQDKAAENKLLREVGPAVIYPPQSIPPPRSEKLSMRPQSRRRKGRKQRHSSRPTHEKPKASKPQLSARLTRSATGIGIFLALIWNAFNSYRASPEKVQAVENRMNQTQKERDAEVSDRVLKDQRELQRWRAIHCWMAQLRGATQRQGLDLPELPPGGVKALKLADEPNRAPQFVADGKCPEFPALPPEMPGP